MLKKSSFYVGILLILVGIGGGCQKDTTNPTPDDSTYFPLQTGDYWIYQVTQETYSLTNAPVKRMYQLQEKVGNSYSQNGQLFFLVEESIKLSTQSDWQINAIHTVYKNVSEVISQESNVPTVRLVFPISSTTSWNVNTYNANPDTLLRYQNSGQSFSIGKQTFDRTVSVVGDNDSTLVDQQKYQRVYAQDIGLIYRENASLAFCQSTPDCVGKGIIASGSRQKWELVSSNRLK
ncbi:hypothetical protein GO730_27795 [Spirosoma sp. HMF3257]|uniref:Uncharacterized protein n=1 Tax=Spirosoma telluris TaxID=2183553 RepID=A0A327NRG3_9BACT|nr:hypothetical protein [Spirosoma telluris]RAI77029.1 hypothetical protein HMF3257_27730 [Spirosoma telluris]